MLQLSLRLIFRLIQIDCNTPHSFLILIISAAFHERKIHLSRFFSKSSMNFSILIGKWLKIIISPNLI
jgi:hypothetical protein